MMKMSIKHFGLHKLFLKALSNETRLLVLESLRTRPKCVSEISEDLDFEQSRVSHSLKCLCNCGFVEVKPKGKKRIYRKPCSISRFPAANFRFVSLDRQQPFI